MEKVIDVDIEDNKITNWGIIGTGRHSNQRIAPAMKLANDTRVIAVYSRDIRNAEAFAQRHNISTSYNTLEGLLDDQRIDSVYVASPNNLHSIHTKKCAEVGKHVLVEKPMAVSVTEAQEMVLSCERNGVKLGVGFHLRHVPGYRMMRHMIEKRILGHIAMAQAQLFFLVKLPQSSSSAWLQKPEMIGGSYSIMAMGVHLIDLLQFLLGQPIIEVAAITDGQTADRPLDNIAAIALRFRDDAIGTICCGRLVPGTCNGVSVYGSEGVITSGGTSCKTFEIISESLNKAESFDFDELTPYTLQIEAFNRALKQNEGFEASGIDGLSVVQVTSAIIESASIGRSVQVKKI